MLFLQFSHSPRFSSIFLLKTSKQSITFKVSLLFTLLLWVTLIYEISFNIKTNHKLPNESFHYLMTVKQHATGNCKPQRLTCEVDFFFSIKKCFCIINPPSFSFIFFKSATKSFFRMSPANFASFSRYALLFSLFNLTFHKTAVFQRKTVLEERSFRNLTGWKV